MYLLGHYFSALKGTPRSIQRWFCCQNNKLLLRMTNRSTHNFRTALTNARKQANKRHHNYIGTEHVLLGLLEALDCRAVQVLGELKISPSSIVAKVEGRISKGPDHKMTGKVPYTPRVKKVLALAERAARDLTHDYVGTEHLLIALLQEGEGVAAIILKGFELVHDKLLQATAVVIGMSIGDYGPDTDFRAMFFREREDRISAELRAKKAEEKLSSIRKIVD